MLLTILQLLLLLASSFVALTIVLIIKKQFGIPLLAILTIAFTLLGIILMLLTLELELKGIVRIFLIIAGISPIAMLISVILHNTISTLVTKHSDKQYEDAVFLILGVFVFPSVFVISDIASIILVARILFS
jgi:hypothetical protein